MTRGERAQAFDGASFRFAEGTESLVEPGQGELENGQAAGAGRNRIDVVQGRGGILRRFQPQVDGHILVTERDRSYSRGHGDAAESLRCLDKPVHAAGAANDPTGRQFRGQGCFQPSCHWVTRCPGQHPVEHPKCVRVRPGEFCEHGLLLRLRRYRDFQRAEHRERQVAKRRPSGVAGQPVTVGRRP